MTSVPTLTFVLRAHAKVIAIFVMATFVCSAIISALLPNSYTGISRVLPPQQSSGLASAFLSQLGLGSLGIAAGTRNVADTYVGLLGSRTVLDAIIAAFDLRNVYDEDTLEDARTKLKNRTTVSLGRDGLITLAVEDRDPKRAAALANSYISELQKLTTSLAITEAAQRRVFFEHQLRKTKNDLANAEVALRETQKLTGLIKLDDQGRAIIENVARLRGLVAAKEVQLSSIRMFATDQNPEFLRIQNEIASLRLQLVRLEGGATGAVGGIFVPTAKIPESGLQYLRSLRDVKYHETIYDILARQYEAARVEEAKDSPVLQIVDLAIEPDKKSGPKRLLIVCISIALAFFVAVLIGFARESYTDLGTTGAPNAQ